MARHWIMAHTSGGFRGRCSSPCKDSEGNTAWWPTREEAEKQAEEWTDSRSPYGPALIWYTYGGVWGEE